MIFGARRRFYLLACALFAVSSAACALTTRLEFTEKRSFGSFRAGEFVLWDGVVHGELSPREAIPGLDKAATNARGNVEYSARIVLIMPADPRRGNGALLVDVPNRGRAYAQGLYNSPRDEDYESGTFEQGTGFLQDNGFSVAEVYWELRQGAELPSFVDAEGRQRYVEGVGFAIVRDTADFLAHAAVDTTGSPNPLAGAINRTLASGKSQDGRFLKTFLLNGYNVAAGHRVFDGMHVIVSAAGLLPILQTGTGPESSANGSPTFANPEFRGVNEDPLTIGDIVARVEARGEVPPKMMLVSSTTDFYSLRASLGRTGASGTTDRPLPSTVRMYDVAGASHVRLARSPSECTMPAGRLDWAPVLRAGLYRLDAWVASNTEPPQSELMPLEPAPPEPAALRAPAHLPGAVIQVPRRDADGNPVGGVRLPDVAVPLGTNGGQNLPHTFLCSLTGSYTPFAVTKVQRESSGDARLSIEERYKNRDDYVNRVRVAAQLLMTRGFLLAEDAAIIVEEGGVQSGVRADPGGEQAIGAAWRSRSGEPARCDAFQPLA